MWYSLGLFVALATLCHCQEETIILQASYSSSQYHRIKVALSCIGGTGNGTLFRKTKLSSISDVIVDGFPNVRDLIFVLDHRNEGIYYCQIEGSLSNELLLVGE